ncbi:TetR/AcrR family transcriptional regulator [Streptomyces sp. CoH17]|uniref:TetR/AcrR family transcriptional regulator n=1 Tax=Streptomyces sp. CoH17 TaxID=2992806 RepID=UPI0022712245|nr:TetR/AcrR family transcriptional regulator [Streptomyces sp. CoH17]
MHRKTQSRTRLLAAAESVFYDQGITTTSIDTVARAAEVTKPTVYTHFPSKSALAAAALTARHARRRAELDACLAAADPGVERVLTVFACLGTWYERGGHRGCAFVNAATQSPADSEILRAAREEKRWLNDTLTTLCAQAGLANPDLVASQLLLLIDGVAGRVAVQGHPAAAEAIDAATQAARALTTAAGGWP